MNATVSSWGDNSNGQLGDGTTSGRHAPARVDGLPGNVRTVDAGSGHVAVLLDDGTALAWGRNAFGQVGDGSTENKHRPVPVRGLRDIKTITCGGGVTIFQLADGTVHGCGAGMFGCLGDANRSISPVPVQIQGLDGEVSHVYCGGGHVLALMADGTVWTWGRDDYGQLGDGPDADSLPGRAVQEHAGRAYAVRFVPARVKGLSDIKAISAGGGHSLALHRDGTVFSWGINDRGQLGDGTIAERAVPARVPNLTNVTALVGAYHHTLALCDDGTLWGFGLNDQGQLGDGTTTHRYTPVKVVGLSEVRQVTACGGGPAYNPGNAGHSMALLADGTVWAWGNNSHGELGDGTTTSRQTAQRVGELANVRHITAGGEVPESRENPGGSFCLALY